MIKRIIGILVLLTILVVGIGHFYSDRLPVGIWTDRLKGKPAQRLEAQAAVLIDGKTGEVLYAKNDGTRKPPASTTKILTALVALKKADINEKVTVGSEVGLITPDESVAGLKLGQQLRLGDLIGALLLPSGNDAARTIAVYIAGKEKGKQKLTSEQALANFVKMMNEEAARLGAKDSHFANPHGMPDAGHYTTARDLALIAKEAMKNPFFAKTVGEDRLTASVQGKQLTFANRNKLLLKDSGYYFAGANGIKTGFTDEAGYCLVASAEQNGKSYIAVVLHSTETQVWSDSERLLKYGFSRTRT